MSQPNDEEARTERARRIGLFRYMLIREAADPSLTRRQRGALVRKLAQSEHIDADGRPVRITRWTLDRWILEWRQGGFDALVPSPRQSQPRTPPEVVELAMALKKENPDRTAAQVRRILRAQLGWAPDERTLQRMFHKTGLIALRAAKPADTFGRFEADRPNELWVGDALHGSRIDGRKTYLFAFLDDHSRAVVGHRWGFSEDTVRLAAALRPALSARGVPQYIYVDNGSAFVDSWLLRACAKLGIKLVHSAPGRPEGRGKIERFFRTVNGEFTVETASDKGEVGREIKDLAEMNRLFTSWVENVYHRRVHSETKQEPLARWMAGAPLSLVGGGTSTGRFRSAAVSAVCIAASAWSKASTSTTARTSAASRAALARRVAPLAGVPGGNRLTTAPPLVGMELSSWAWSCGWARSRPRGRTASVACPAWAAARWAVASTP